MYAINPTGGQIHIKTIQSLFVIIHKIILKFTFKFTKTENQLFESSMTCDAKTDLIPSCFQTTQLLSQISLNVLMRILGNYAGEHPG